MIRLKSRIEAVWQFLGTRNFWLRLRIRMGQAAPWQTWPVLVTADVSNYWRTWDWTWGLLGSSGVDIDQSSVSRLIGKILTLESVNSILVNNISLIYRNQRCHSKFTQPTSPWLRRRNSGQTTWVPSKVLVHFYCREKFSVSNGQVRRVSALQVRLRQSCFTPGNALLLLAETDNADFWLDSVWETVDPAARDLKKEIGKIEDQMLSRKRAATPLTPVIPEAHDK